MLGIGPVSLFPDKSSVFKSFSNVIDSGIFPTKLFDFKLRSVVTLCICSRHVTPYHVHTSVSVFQLVLCNHDSPAVALYRSTSDFLNTCGATWESQGQNIPKRDVVMKKVTKMYFMASDF